MLWWVATIIVWLISFTGIMYVMADVFRGKTSSIKAIPGYLFHGVTAILAAWLFMQALAS